MNHILTNWRTSLSGFLSFIIATGAVFTAMPPNWLNPKYSAGLTIAVGLAKAWVGMISKDAGTTEAIVPGQGVKVVESHETPNDPNAIPVKGA